MSGDSVVGIVIALSWIAYAIMALAVAVALHDKPGSLEKVQAVIMWPGAISPREDEP